MNQEKLEKLEKLNRVERVIDDITYPLLTMVVDSNKGEFPFPELSNDLSDAFLALNRVSCKIYKLRDCDAED